MNPTGTPTIRLRGTADVLAALPYQLGYHPQDALVVVALHDRRIGMIQRIDLPPSELVDVAGSSLVEPMVRQGPDAVLLVGYEQQADMALPLLVDARQRFTAAGVDVVDVLVVRDGRWFSPTCDTGCCPAEGQALAAPADVPAVADFIGMEASPLPTRGSLAELVAADEAVSPEVEAALNGGGGAGVAWAGQALGLRRAQSPSADHALAVRRLTWLAIWAVVCDVSEASRPIDSLVPAEVAQLVTSLADVELRDGLVAWLCPGTLPLDCLSADLVDAIRNSLPGSGAGCADHARDPEVLPDGDRSAAVRARRLVARLQWVARAVPDDRSAGVLTVLANVAWWAGDGTLARVALDRALQHTPDYRLAVLTERLVDLAIRPQRSVAEESA